MQTGNILFGFNLAVASVKVGAYGDAEGAAVDIGRTDGGVEVSIEHEIKHVETDQDPGPVSAKEIRRVGKLRFNMAEATLANLAVALNLPVGAVSGSTLKLGAETDGEIYRTVYINTDGPAGGTRKYTLQKCVVISTGLHSYMKDDKSVIECEMDILWDTTQAAGEEMGTVVDTGADTTAPTVVLLTPADGGTVTKVTSDTVTWQLTEANRIDESSIVYGDTFQIINTTVPATATLEAGTIVYDATLKRVVFTPSSPWTASDTFQAIVSTGLQDEAGNNLAATKIEQFSVTA